MAEIDLSLSDDALAGQLAASPENSEEFDGALAKAVLYGQSQDPARYARICALAFTLATSDERRATFMLGRVNGERRIRETWEPSVALEMLDQVTPVIAEVADGVRQRRLKALQAYHDGIVSREAGEYERAALAQDRSAELETAPALAQVSRFCATVERGHHALVVGDAGLITSALEEARVQGVALMRFNPGNLEEPHRGTLIQWQLANRPAHLLYLYWLARLNYDGQEQDQQKFLYELPVDLRAAYAHWIGVLKAAQEFTSGNFHRAEGFADDVLVSDTYPASTALAMLILAQINRIRGLRGYRRALLRGIVSLPGHGGHFVRAVATRELATFK